MKIYNTVENKMPEGALCHDVLTSDGVLLRAVTARQSMARGTVFILNGRADFIERYFETMRDITKRRLAVVAFDWRGQGGSQRLLKDRIRGYIKNFAHFDLDLEAIVALAKRLDFPEPYYALAHSTGGHVLLRALRDKTYFKRAVITSPLLGFHFGRWPLPVVRILNFVFTYSGFSWLYLPGFARGPMRREEFPNNPLTSDRERWNRDNATLEEYPELGLGGPTYAWLRAAMKSLDEIHSWPQSKGPSCPTMIVMAGQDRVVNNLRTRQFVDRVPGISVLTIPASRHEILNENNAIRAKFLAAFDAFMEFDRQL